MNYNGFMSHYSTNGLYNDPNFINLLTAKISNNLGRNLSRAEYATAASVMKNIDPVIFKGKRLNDIINAMASTITDEINKNPCHGDEEENIHETLKGMIGIKTQEGNIAKKYDKQANDQLIESLTGQTIVSSFLGLNNITDIQKVISPNLVKKTVSIVLDTRNRALDNDGTEYFRWNFINNEITTQGTVNAIGNIRDIVRMRVSQIRIPLNNSSDNDYSRITLYIKEFSAQSFISAENRFHFMFLVDRDGYYAELHTDGFNDGFFRFRNPIVSLDSLTLYFASPFENITFDTDRSYGSITDYNISTEITTLNVHNLHTGDRVYISGFTTANPNTDNAVIGLINYTTGCKIVATGSNTFLISVNSSSIFTQGAGTLTVTNGSASIVGVGTNFTTFIYTNDYIGIGLGINEVVYKVAYVSSDTSLTLTNPYTGTTAAGVGYYRDNRTTGFVMTIYFGSKRIFIPIELEFYDSGSEF